MIGFLIWAAALAGEPPPPCRYHEVIWEQAGAVLRDTVDEYLCRIVVVDGKGDTLIVANQYTEITPAVYKTTHRTDVTARKLKRLDSLLLQMAKEKK